MRFKKLAAQAMSFVLTAGMLASGFGGALQTANAADHRDSNAVDARQEGDFSDVFAWVDPADNDNVILALAVNVFANPNLNPSYRFAEDFLYQMKIDNGGALTEDLVMQVKFTSTNNGGQGFTATLGTPSVVGPRGNRELTNGTELCRGNEPNPSATPAVPGGIYTGAAAVTDLQDDYIIEGPADPRGSSAAGVKCWVGIADDSFQTDVAQIIFRIGLNPNTTQNANNHTQDVGRGFVSTGFGPLRGRPLRLDGTSGVDGFGGYNASHAVVSIPRHMLTNGGQGITDIRTGQRDPNLIGVWGTVSRPESETFDGFSSSHGDTFAQFERMGQQVAATVWVFNTPPLNDTQITAGAVNTVVGGPPLIPGDPTRVLGTPELKDLHNNLGPETDQAIFERLTPTSLLSGGILSLLQNTIEGRKTLLTAGGFINIGITGTPYLLDELPASAPLRLNQDRNYQKKLTWPDYMRLNVTLVDNAVRPGAAASGNSSAYFGIGRYGYQNGRRPADDVVDIYLRIAREMTDVQFGNNIAPILLTGNPLPGFEPFGANPARRPLDCRNLIISLTSQQILVPCTDARIFNVLQGTDFIERTVLDINNLANQVSDQRALEASFPYFGKANPVNGENGTSEFPPQK